MNFHVSKNSLDCSLLLRKTIDLIFIIIFIFLSKDLYSNDGKYKIVFKPNKNLQYKVLLYSRPNNVDLEIMDYFLN